MKAAVSIKSAQLDQKKRKFEKLPSFAKASVYYSNKLETVRKQDFFPKLFAFQLIRKEADQEFLNKNYDRACRKYEEGLSIFRYYYSLDPKWSEQGIDDKDLRDVDFQGNNEFERQEAKKIKLQSYLNIAACSIKTKDFESAVHACNEALKIDPLNKKALFRRARATALPINSGVEEFKKALTDLKSLNQLDPNNAIVEKEIKRLSRLVEINRKREHETYGKMFSKS